MVLYRQPDCPPCAWRKGFLAERGVWRSMSGTSSWIRRRAVDLTAKYKSHSTPTLVVGDEVLIGFDPERIEKILGE
jgi:glutaredoxin